MTAKRKHCVFDYDTWIADGYLYVKGTGRQYERASQAAFDLGIRRKMRRELARLGADPDFARGMGGMVVWDVARNIADLLPEAYTYRTATRLPADVLDQYRTAA